MNVEPFLRATPYLDFDDPAVFAQALALARGEDGVVAVAQRCFEFVRDEILHSWDHQRGPVTCKASEVLRHRTGYCYAKSHLLAALLRANGIPAGLVYQRLSVGESGAPYCLHGLNAVYLPDHGWYRVDARGNKSGISARFEPPVEQLAFAVRPPDEHDFRQIFADPLPVVLAALEAHEDIQDLHRALPDEVPPEPAGEG